MARGDDRIRRFYLFRAVTSFSLWIPFWTLWVYKNLESLFLITVVDAAFWSTMILFQIPAGLLGDRYGRRVVLFAGEALFAVGVLTFGLSTEFWQYLVSNIVWALGVCFIVSGDTPFLYDTLVELNRASEFIPLMARANAFMYVMNAIACVIGGLIVQETGRLELTLIIASMVGLTGSFTVLLLKEPKVDRTNLGTYRTQLKDGLRTVMSSRAILVLVFFQVVVEIALYVMAVFRSVYMNVDLALGFFEVGLFFASFALVSGFVMTQAGKIEEGLGEKRSLLFMLCAMVGSFGVVFLVRSPVAIVVQYLVYMVAGLLGPITNGYINKRVDSAHRSTVMAIAMLTFTFMLTFIEVCAGWLATAWGTRESLLVLALAITPVGFYLLAIWNKEVDAGRRAKKVRVLRQF